MNIILLSKNACHIANQACLSFSIGFDIARRLGQDGAQVVISSRNQQKVDNALAELKSQNLSISGMVCHVSKDEHRKSLVQKVNKFIYNINY